MEKVKSDYFKSLDTLSTQRYCMKIADINGEDPYAIPMSELSNDIANCPKIIYLDIVNYLVYTKSFYTAEDFKAHKGLEAYNQFSSGSVQDLQSKQFGDKSLIIGKVVHSQSFNAKLLVPWVIAEENGVITSAHCTCMAGLAEACTHIGAILFFVEYGVRVIETRTVTQELAYWPVPSAKEVPYSRIKDIDFSTPKKKCKVLEERIGTTKPSSSSADTGSTVKVIPAPTAEEIRHTNQLLADSGVKCAFLSVTRSFQTAFIPAVDLEVSPLVDLSRLHDPNLYELDHAKLLEKCSSVDLSVTQNDALKVEELTRNQSSCKLWFRFRSGRVTSSNFKKVCHARSPTSSPSLIKLICYPEEVKFKNKATGVIMRKMRGKSMASSYEKTIKTLF